MSDTNRVRVSIARTSQRGGSGVDPVPVNPASFSPASNLFQLRYTGTPGLGSQPNSVVSAEIRSDRQTADSILVGTEAGGNVEGELSMMTFDELIQGTLFTTYKNTHVTVPISTGVGTITVPAGGAFDDEGYALNQILRVKLPAASPAIDSLYYVTAKAAGLLTISPLRAGVDVAMPTGATITNGTVTVCGVRGDAASDITVALNTPSTGFTTLTFANEVAAAWAIAYPDVAGTAGTLPTIGNWIKLAQMTDSAQNQYGRLVSVTSTTAVIETPAGMTATVGPIGAELYWGSYIRNPIVEAGATPANIGQFVPGSIPANSFLVERRYEDHTPITRELILGCAVNQFNLTLDPQSILNLSVEFFGFKSNVSDDSPNYADVYSSLPTDVVPTDTDVINTSTNVGVVSLTGENLLAGDLSAAKNLPLQVQLNIGNQLRRRNAVGVFGAASIGAGRLNIGGNVNTYFDSKQILELIVRNLDAEYVTSVASNDGRGLLFDLPRIKFTSGAPDVPGGDADAVLNPAYQALRSPTFGYTIHITKWNFVR